MCTLSFAVFLVLVFGSLFSLDLASLIALKYTIMDNSWDSYTVRVLFKTRYINIRALLTLHGPIPSPHPTDSVETV